MIGAIIGDVVGSIYEWNNIKRTDFPLFTLGCKMTDDSVMTLATAYAILNDKSYDESYRIYYELYPGRGYGNMFHKWASTKSMPAYNSFGNGSAMRISPVGWIYDNLDDTLKEAKKSAEVTHNHLEGIRGAQAIAAAIFLGRTGKSKEEIKDYIEKTFGYNLSQTCDEIRPKYKYDTTCQGTVPQAIIAFLESTGFENAIRLAVSLGGDCDTLTCITGGIAQAYYKDIPQEIIDKVSEYLDSQSIELINIFNQKYGININLKKYQPKNFADLLSTMF